MNFLKKLFGARKQQPTADQQPASERASVEDSSAVDSGPVRRRDSAKESNSTEGSRGKIILQDKNFLLMEMEPPPVYLALLRETYVKQMSATAKVSPEEAAKITAGMLFAGTRGLATKADITRVAYEISQKCMAKWYSRLSDAIHFKELPPSWESPGFFVAWPRGD